MNRGGNPRSHQRSSQILHSHHQKEFIQAFSHFLKVIILGFFISAMAACSSHKSIAPEQIRHLAPQSEKDTGTILMGVSESDVIDLSEKYPTAKFRPVSKRPLIYEVFHLNAKILKEELPHAELYQNKFYKTQKAEKFGTQSLEKLKSLSLITNEESSSINSQESPQQETPQQPKPEERPLANCNFNAEDLPLPSASLNGNLLTPETNDATTVNFGGHILLDSTSSQENPKAPSTLKHYWIVQPSESSNQKMALYGSKTIDILPDSLGGYQFMLVLKDNRNACTGMLFQVTVTDNPKFEGYKPEYDQLSSEQSLSQFQHLAELHAEEAWAYSTGKGVTVAIIDSGVNYNHFALAKNIAVNTREIPDNGIDDDGDGFVDDVIGYDFANMDAYPFDDDGHGSHVSGLAASSLMGMAKDSKILPLKAGGAFGIDLASVIGAIYYAVNYNYDQFGNRLVEEGRNVRVINLSLGIYLSAFHDQDGFHKKVEPLLMKTFNYAANHNVLVIAAAGNGDPMLGLPVDIDKTPMYPASLSNDNLVVVAARGATTDDLLASYSNFGVNTVDVVAPGGDAKDAVHTENEILSCFMANPKKIVFQRMMGTSMASPIVTGIAAQVMSERPDISLAEVKQVLMEAGDTIPLLKPMVGSAKYIDALSAVKLALQK